MNIVIFVVGDIDVAAVVDVLGYFPLRSVTFDFDLTDQILDFLFQRLCDVCHLHAFLFHSNPSIDSGPSRFNIRTECCIGIPGDMEGKARDTLRTRNRRTAVVYRDKPANNFILVRSSSRVIFTPFLQSLGQCDSYAIQDPHGLPRSKQQTCGIPPIQVRSVAPLSMLNFALFRIAIS